LEELRANGPLLKNLFPKEGELNEVMRQCHLLKGIRIKFSDDLTDERKQRKIVINAQKEAKN
jgi:hypothetical protein